MFLKLVSVMAPLRFLEVTAAHLPGGFRGQLPRERVSGAVPHKIFLIRVQNGKVLDYFKI